MRTLLATPAFPPARGGIETLSVRLAAMMPQDSLRVVCLDSQGSLEPEPLLGCAVRRVRNQPAGGRRSVCRLNWATVAEARYWLPDVLLSMHVRVAPAAEIVRRSGIPYVQYVHAKEMLEFPRLARAAVQRAQAVIGVSRYSLELALAAGAEAASAHIVPNGVGLSASSRATPGASRPRMITVSRLDDAYKGHDVVLQALPLIITQVPDVHWDVVGDGALREPLQHEARRRGLGAHITFTGRLSDAERDALMDQATVFVMPTRHPGAGRAGEGFGIVFLEAGARGVPVVAGRTPGVLDAVAEGQSGLLVDPTDATAVASAVTNVLLNSDLRAALSTGARRHAEAFSWDRVASGVVAHLQSAMARGPSLSTSPATGVWDLLLGSVLPPRAG